jgi:hypothetical protein
MTSTATTVTATTSLTVTAYAATASGGSDVASTLDLLDRSRHSLLLACQSSDTTTRHQHAQLAALRAAASVLAARRDPRSPVVAGSGGPGPRSLWELLPRLAPELAEWASFFEVVTSGPGPVSARDADDLLRQAEIFLDLVRRSLGVPAHTPGQVDLLVPTLACALPEIGHDTPPCGSG